MPALFVERLEIQERPSSTRVVPTVHQDINQRRDKAVSAAESGRLTDGIKVAVKLTAMDC